MPETKMIDLYMGKSISDLNKTSEYKYEQGRSLKIHINHSDKVFEAAKEAKNKHDEERSYVLYMRYIDIVQKVRKSKDFKKDPNHYSLMMGQRRIVEALDAAEELSKSLRERYELKEAEDVCKKIDAENENTDNGVKTKERSPEKIPSENNIKTQPSNEISCKQLYETLFSKHSTTKVLVMDIRTSEDYKESTIKHKSCINVPHTSIKPGTTSKAIEQGILDEDHLDKWWNRGAVDIVVMLDWRCNISRLNEISDPLTSLKDALYKWEQNIFLKKSPVILDGGYCEWLEIFPQFTTNSKVLPPDLEKKPDTSVNSLLNFTFGRSKKISEEEIDDVEDTVIEKVENGTEEAKVEIKEEVNEPTYATISPKIPITPTSPSSGMYPTIPTDIDLASNKKINGVKEAEMETKPVTAVSNSKQIPTINRSLKPVIPSRDLKPIEPKPTTNGGTWPPQEFNSVETVKPVISTHQEDETDAILKEMEKIRKKKEENERITRELKQKQKQSEMQAEFNRMKREAEESERVKKQAEKDLAESLRKNTKPKPINNFPSTPVAIETTSTPSNNPQIQSQPDKNLTAKPAPEFSRATKNILKQNSIKKAPASSTSESVVQKVEVKKDSLPKESSSFVTPILKPNTDSNNAPTALTRSNSNSESKTTGVSSKSNDSSSSDRSTKPVVMAASIPSKPSLIKPPVNKLPVPTAATNPPSTNQYGPTPSSNLPSPKQPKVASRITGPSSMANADTESAKHLNYSEYGTVAKKSSTKVGGLPLEWEKRLDAKTGRYFYINHVTKSTHWQLPEGVVQTSIKRVPLKDSSNALASGSLKRSHSTPNIAEAAELAELATPSIPSRGSKPEFRKTAYESPDVLNHRLQSLNPVKGGGGKGLCGLRNLGNTCYMNSVLQCMINTVQVIKYFLNGYYVQDINRENFLGSGGDITDGFAVALKAIWSGKYEQITPRDFRSTIARINPRFDSYQQQDSQELLLFLMDGLHEDLNQIKHRQYIEEKENDKFSDHEAAEIAWMDHKKLNKSIIVELFQGQFRATTQCMECKKKSRKFDIFMYLSLPLPTSRSCSLMDAIRKFSEPERLSGENKWMCPQCKAPRNASRIIEVWKLPPVLLIHFKRFSFSNRYTEKIQTNVSFPINNLDLSPAVKDTNYNRKMYNLYAVSHHHGNTLDSGHYIATCKNACNGNWYKFDDESVSKTSAPSGPTAYILCYTSYPHKMELQSK